jgi:hypothetical protein
MDKEAECTQLLDDIAVFSKDISLLRNGYHRFAGLTKPRWWQFWKFPVYFVRLCLIVSSLGDFTDSVKRFTERMLKIEYRARALGVEIPRPSFGKELEMRPSDILAAFSFAQGFDEYLDSIGFAVAGVRKKLMVSDQADSSSQAVAITIYEQEAFLSYGLAIQAFPSLANATNREVYNWICDNGIRVNDKNYEPPSFATWQKYRSAGERKARQA